MGQAHIGLFVLSTNLLGELPTRSIEVTQRAQATPSRHRERMRAAYARCLRSVSGARISTKHRYGSASGRREAGESGTWEYNDLVEFSEAEAAQQTKNVLSSFFPPCGGGLGGAAQNEKNFLGLHTRVVASMSEAHSFVRITRRSARTS